MTQSKPKRPWLRLHLSTALLLTFAAGGLIWANTAEQRAPYDRANPPPPSLHDFGIGWPFIVTFYLRFPIDTFPDGPAADALPEGFRQTTLKSIRIPRASETPELFVACEEYAAPLDISMLLLDIAVAFILLATLGTACEWRIRRQEQSARAKGLNALAKNSGLR